MGSTAFTDQSPGAAASPPPASLGQAAAPSCSTNLSSLPGQSPAATAQSSRRAHSPEPPASEGAAGRRRTAFSPKPELRLFGGLPPQQQLGPVGCAAWEMGRSGLSPELQLRVPQLPPAQQLPPNPEASPALLAGPHPPPLYLRNLKSSPAQRLIAFPLERPFPRQLRA